MRRSYDDNMRENARRAYARHEIRESAPGRWLLMAPDRNGGWSGNMWTSVLVDHGRVILHGDGELAYFGGYSGEGGDEGVVRWVARNRGDMRCLAGKAGYGASKLAYETDTDVAAANVIDLMRDAIEDAVAEEHDVIAEQWLSVGDRFDDNDDECVVPGDADADHAAGSVLRWLLALVSAMRAERWSDRARDRFDGIDDATECLESGDVEGARRALYDGGWDSERVSGIGEVIAPRIYYAQAACARLVALWERAEKTQSTSA